MRLHNLQAAEKRILDLLNDRPYEPTEIAAALRPEFDDRVVREALWRLINETQVDWTGDRTLKRIQAAAI